MTPMGVIFRSAFTPNCEFRSQGVRLGSAPEAPPAPGGPMCPFLLHVGLALDLDLHARIYQPFHLNERRDR